MLPDWVNLTTVFGGTSLAALLTIGWGIVKDIRGGGLRKSRSEADRAGVEVDQLEATGPLAIEGIRLSHVAQVQEAQSRALLELGAQLTAANARTAERDRQLFEADTENARLRAAMREKDSRIDELELRLGVAEDELARARRIINELRHDAEPAGPDPRQEPTGGPSAP